MKNLNETMQKENVMHDEDMDKIKRKVGIKKLIWLLVIGVIITVIIIVYIRLKYIIDTSMNDPFGPDLPPMFLLI